MSRPRAKCSACGFEFSVNQGGELSSHIKKPRVLDKNGWPEACGGKPLATVRLAPVDEQILATLTEIRELLRTIHHAVMRQP